MKVPDNKISSVKSYFFESLKSFSLDEVNNYFSFLCDAWLYLSKADLLLNPDVEISESELLKFLYAIKDLKKNRPIQYIAGKTWFYGIEVYVKEGVLIPRPETEELVQWVISDCKYEKQILDIGTGSGCIPLAIKNSLRDIHLTGYDVSKDAIEIARKNAGLLNLEVNFNEFDILNWRLFPQENKFDTIVSNPPYIPEFDKKIMHKNVLNYEPKLALFVPDNDPLVFYKAIADFSLINLNEQGKLYLEIHESYGREVVQMLTQVGYGNIELRKDLQGKDRMIKASLI
tara:strand:- start:1266 stop:2126 length:861 start_codon:yes stop_codon:yes gene_type:complete